MKKLTPVQLAVLADVAGGGDGRRPAPVYYQVEHTLERRGLLVHNQGEHRPNLTARGLLALKGA